MGRQFRHLRRDRDQIVKELQQYWVHCVVLDLYKDVPEPADIGEAMLKLFPDRQWTPGHFYTDASGGKHTDNVRLRRVGIGAVSLYKG